MSFHLFGPRNVGSTSRPRWILNALGVVIGFAIAAMGALGVVQFHDIGDRLRQTETTLVKVVDLSWGYRVVLEGGFYDVPIPTLQDANREIRNELMKNGEILTSLSSDPDIMRIFEAVAALGTKSNDGLNALARGDTRLAGQILAEVHSQHEALIASAAKVQAIISRRADRANTKADIASTAVLFASAITVLGLFAVLERRRRREAVDREHQLALRASEERFRSLVHNATDMITVLDVDGAIIYESPAVERLLGFPVEERLGATGFSRVHQDDDARLRQLFAELITTPGATVTGEARVQAADGTWHWVESVGTNLLEEPSLKGLVFNYRIIDERKALEQRLTHQAYHDPLTGLANRPLFRERLDHALRRRTDGTPRVGLLFFDLDDFKTVNDGLGHQAGDQLLVMVGERIGSCLRPEDTVARLGGDEYAIIVESPPDAAAVTDVAARVVESMKAPFRLGGMELFVHGSIGVVVDSGREDVDTLVRAADIAMYVAKARGKGMWELFRDEMDLTLRQRVDVESGLRRALAQDELVLHYQPIVALSSGKVSGVEALVRWDHPDRGLLPPNEFISHAEESGLIAEIGVWVLREACARLRRWRNEIPDVAELTMSVNVSPRQLVDESFSSMVDSVLREHAIAPGDLILEVTEGALVRDQQAVSRTLMELKELGVRVAIDDFGTGYSSLSRLQQLPIDIIKLDRSFVAGVANGAEDAAVARATVKLGSAFRLHTVAEGVEHEEQGAALRALGCEFAQGYYFGRPADAAATARMLAESTIGDRLIEQAFEPIESIEA